MAKIQSLEQKRAKLAWEFIKEVATKDKSKQKEFKSAIRKLPAMVLSSGLGQTVAFYISKEGCHHEILKDLAKAISILINSSDINTPEELIEKLANADHESYILLSNETLKYATWLKRFAEAKLEG